MVKCLVLPMSSVRCLLLISLPSLISSFLVWGTSHCASCLFLSSVHKGMCARRANTVSWLVLSLRATECVDPLWHCTKASMALIS